MIAELEKVGLQRLKEADLSDVYERFSQATQRCRQVVTKRLTIITSLVEYHGQWQLVSGHYLGYFNRMCKNNIMCFDSYTVVTINMLNVYNHQPDSY